MILRSRSSPGESYGRERSTTNPKRSTASWISTLLISAISSMAVLGTWHISVATASVHSPLQELPSSKRRIANETSAFARRALAPTTAAAAASSTPLSPSPMPSYVVPAHRTPEWDAPAYDPRTTSFFFAHIPFTGGTAVSWHIVGALASQELGGVAPGSAASGRFEPRALVKGKGRAGAWDEKWLSGARATDGSGPLYKAAFGHNYFSDEALEKYGGSLAFGTMIRKGQYNAKLQKPFVCHHLSSFYAPWWKLGTDGLRRTPEEEEIDAAEYAEAARTRPQAPPELQAFCTGPWRRRSPVRLMTSPQALWLGRKRRFGVHQDEHTVPYASSDLQYSPADAAVLDALVRDGHVAVADAAHGLLQMSWFGIHDYWPGSMCLLHHVTKWPWPHEHSRACGMGEALYSRDFSQLTRGPAAGSPRAGRHASPPQQVTIGRHSHMGSSPGQQNRMACCPIRVAERMLQYSSTRRVMAWLHRAHRNVSSAVTHASEKPRSALRSSPYPTDYRGLFYSLDPSAHNGDVDATLLSWAERIFRYRLHRAAVELSESGYSAENVPGHLSPDCFLDPVPGGFRV